MTDEPRFADPLAVEFGAMIQEAREGLGYTQAKVAGELGVQQGTVSKWESGDRMPSSLNQMRLVRLLGLSPERYWRLLHNGGTGPEAA